MAESDDDEGFLKQAVDAFLIDSQMASTAGYLRRGRAYADLSDKGLETLYVKSSREMGADPADSAKRNAFMDVVTEYDLRGLEPPKELVKGDWQKVTAFINEMLERKRQEDPEGYEQLEEELSAGRRRCVEQKRRGQLGGLGTSLSPSAFLRKWRSNVADHRTISAARRTV